MESLFIIIPLIVIIVIIASGAFIWAVNKKQFDDLESPAQDIIFDDRQSRQSLMNPPSPQPPHDTPPHD